MSVEAAVLDFAQVYAREVISRRLLSGAYHAELHTMQHAIDGLVIDLTAYMLAEDAGPEIHEVRAVRASLPLKPRWLPARFWRRLRCVEAEWQLEVHAQPQWSYPQSTVSVPELGRAVQLMVEPTVSWRSSVSPVATELGGDQ